MAIISIDNVKISATEDGPVQELRFKGDDPRVQFSMHFEGDERGKLLHGDTVRIDIVKTSSNADAVSALAEAEIKSIKATAEAAVEERRSAGKKAKK